MLEPDVGAAAIALTPAAEAALGRMVDTLGQRRYQHAAQTLTDAADAACDALEDFVEKAVADDRRHELRPFHTVGQSEFLVQDAKHGLRLVARVGLCRSPARLKIVRRRSEARTTRVGAWITGVRGLMPPG